MKYLHKKIFLCLGLTMLLSACSHTIPAPINYKSLAKELAVGMTKEEVIKIFGMPVRKKIDGKKETYYFYSVSNSNVSAEVLDTLGTLILSPIGLIIGQDPLVIDRASSSYELHFDENGRLESF